MVTDQELLEACRAGRTAAFAELVDRYQGVVAAVTFATTGDRNLSEDLAQDTFVAAWRQLHELREPSRFRAWLCGIARNLASKARRRWGREVVVNELRAVDAAPAIDDALADEQAEAIVWRSLESLPLTYREPLILYYREGRSAQQVADVLGLTVTAVEQRLSRGRKQLGAGVESLVERSLERSRPRRRLAVAVTGAIQGGAAVAPAKGGAVVKIVFVSGAVAVAIAGGDAICSTRDDLTMDARAAVHEVREGGEVEPEPTGVAREVIERIEARDRQAAAAAEASDAVPGGGAAVMPFELTRVSDRSVGVSLLGGQSGVTAFGFRPNEAVAVQRTISGRVMDERGQPMRGVVVIGGKRLTNFGGTTVMADGGAVTDADGRWSFEMPHTDASGVVALDRKGVSEAALVPAGDDARTVHLSLVAPASFGGSVTHGEVPVAAQVRLHAKDPWRGFATRADERGSFELEYVPPGVYTAVASLSYADDESISARVTAQVVITSGKRTEFDFVLPLGALVVAELAWPKEHSVAMVGYYLVPGAHIPATAEALRALHAADPRSRYLLVGGDNLLDAMSFSDVEPGNFTACAVGSRDRDTVVGLDCARVEVTEGSDTFTVELDPFGD